MNEKTPKAKALFDKLSKDEVSITVNKVEVTVLMDGQGCVSVFSPDSLDVETAIDMLLFGVLYLRQKNHNSTIV